MSVAPKVLNDKALEDYYQALFAMYPTDGWRVLQEDLTRLKEVYNNLGTVDSNELLWFRKGQLDVVEQMLSHAERSEAGYRLAIEEQEGGDVEESTGGIAKVVNDPRL